jgi:hypothetical protein
VFVVSAEESTTNSHGVMSAQAAFKLFILRQSKEEMLMKVAQFINMFLSKGGGTYNGA